MLGITKAYRGRENAKAHTAFSLLSHPTNAPLSVRNLSLGRRYARLLGGLPARRWKIRDDRFQGLPALLAVKL